MKILSLTAENIKKLVAVEIAPDGNMIEITGKNGSGKTSVLDSIWWALKWSDHIQSKPIRDGESKARIRLDLGDLIVERRFTEKGSYLTVETTDGAQYKSPQKVLDDLIGALSFDPLAFARMDPKKQFEELRRVANVDVDFDEIRAANKTDYDRRTEINREFSRKTAAAQAIDIPDDLPDEPIDETHLLDLIEQAGEHNAEVERRKASRREKEEQINAAQRAAAQDRERAAELRKQAERMEQHAKDMDAKARDLNEALKKEGNIPGPIDVSDLRADLNRAREMNAKLTKAVERRRLEAEAEELKQKADALTEAMEERKRAAQEAVAKAQLPVEGLSFGDGQVLYNGVPFEQASSAEQIQVSMAVAMAANPKLRVIRIQDGSLLDEDALAHIAEMAEEKDYQVWIERVDTSGRVGIVIEDGHVKASSLEAAE